MEPSDAAPQAALAAIDYLKSLDKFWSVRRELKDGTPVTGFSPEETVMLVEFLADAAKPANRIRFRAYYECAADANPYVLSLVGWRPILSSVAEAMGGALVFAAPSPAGGELSAISLFTMSPMEFISWGDIAKIWRHKPELLEKKVIMGELDFPTDSSSRSMSSGDGVVSAEETLAAVTAMARSGRVHMVLFHRTGWDTPFNIAALTSALASPPGAPRPADASAQGGAPAKKGCFIATACYGTAGHAAVHVLQRYRDEELSESRIGRTFIALYERWSPPLALRIAVRPRTRALIRRTLVQPVAGYLSRRRPLI